MISGRSQGKPFSITEIQVYALITNAQEAGVEWYYDDLLLLLSHFSCVRLCVTPQTAAHRAPQSLGFSRQEYWSGLPFPSPMHASEK